MAAIMACSDPGILAAGRMWVIFRDLGDCGGKMQPGTASVMFLVRRKKFT